VQDEELSQIAQNLKDVHLKELSSNPAEKTSSSKSLLKLMAIPLDLVLIPAYVFRPETKKPKKGNCSPL